MSSALSLKLRTVPRDSRYHSRSELWQCSLQKVHRRSLSIVATRSRLSKRLRRTVTYSMKRKSIGELLSRFPIGFPSDAYCGSLPPPTQGLGGACKEQLRGTTAPNAGTIRCRFEDGKGAWDAWKIAHSYRSCSTFIARASRRKHQRSRCAFSA